MGTPKLTDKQLMFCKEYIIDLNATQACIRSGYIERTAEQQASRLLRNVKVQSEVNRLKAIREKKIGLTAEKVLEDIERVRNKAEVSEQFNVSLKASELQGKHLAMFTEKHQVDGEIKMPVVQIELADV